MRRASIAPLQPLSSGRPLMYVKQGTIVENSVILLALSIGEKGLICLGLLLMY